MGASHFFKLADFLAWASGQAGGRRLISSPKFGKERRHRVCMQAFGQPEGLTDGKPVGRPGQKGPTTGWRSGLRRIASRFGRVELARGAGPYLLEAFCFPGRGLAGLMGQCSDSVRAVFR